MYHRGIYHSFDPPYQDACSSRLRIYIQVTQIITPGSGYTSHEMSYRLNAPHLLLLNMLIVPFHFSHTFLFLKIAKILYETCDLYNNYTKCKCHNNRRFTVCFLSSLAIRVCQANVLSLANTTVVDIELNKIFTDVNVSLTKTVNCRNSKYYLKSGFTHTF